jgi:ubiquinone/menaquinone biosynthesis C-methylase UbiE
MTAANEAQRDAWNGDSGHRWVADADRRDRVLAPVAGELLTAAQLAPGEDVIDIGCGCGATTLAAARAVQPGTVTGVDLSTPMLDVARQRARADENVTFVQADAQTDDLARNTFDVAISRFGTMFFDDPVAAFTNIAVAIRPGGRLCLATWQPLAANEWLLVPGAALLRYGSLPDTSGTGPGMFAQSDPAAVTAVLERAGWRDVAVEPVTVRLRLGGDAEDATDYLADIGLARAVLDTLDEHDRDRAVADVTRALAAHATDDGVLLDAGMHIITAALVAL